MAWTRAALALVAAGAVGVAVVSGGSSADPRTPAALPGLPPPFLGTAVVGGGGLTAAIDAYGDVVDLRAPGPAGRALIDNPAGPQAAGSVADGTGIVPRVSIDGGAALPLWRADSVIQRYLPGTNVLRTVTRFGRVRVVVTDAASGEELARTGAVAAPKGLPASFEFEVNVEAGVACGQERVARTVALTCAGDGSPTAPAEKIASGAIGDGRRWIARARPLSPAAPLWAQRMYRRSLLTLRALTDRRTGAVAAGARDGWAYVWPRDAATAALAYAAAGYRPEARRVARFLLSLDLSAAARFHGDGTPVEGREAQGDAAGWVAAAARGAGLAPPTPSRSWRDRADYQEGERGDYLANAFAEGRPVKPFEVSGGLVRRAGDPESGLDSAAAWAVRPFSRPALFPAVHRTLLRLARDQTRFGITPGEAWPGTDPWSAPTAWTAWSLAALAIHERGRSAAARHDRRAALGLLGALRRAATPAGTLPERVDAHTGVPTSTTPLAWSHAFAILALRELWP